MRAQAEVAVVVGLWPPNLQRLKLAGKVERSRGCQHLVAQPGNLRVPATSRVVEFTQNLR